MFFRKKRNLKEDLEIASRSISEEMISAGYHADYTIESLKEVDRFMEEERKDGGLLTDHLGAKLFGLGAYVGDVFIKKYGGQWITHDRAKDGEMTVTVQLDNEITFMPVISVMKSYQDEEAPKLYVLALAIQRSLEE